METTSVFGELIKSLMQDIKDYQDILDKRVISAHNYIVEVGALTVGVDPHTKRSIVQNVKYPTQFSADTAKELASLAYKTMDGKAVTASVTRYDHYYQEKIKSCEATLDTLKLLA